MKSDRVAKGRSSIPLQYINFGRHLVYSEGTKTEPYYVENIKENIAIKYDCDPNKVEIIAVNENDKSFSTIKLVKYAIDDVDKRIKKGEKINQVWIFFDKDSFDINDYCAAHNLIEKQNDSEDIDENDYHYNKKTHIAWHSCWSNEAFEFWFLLNYEYCESSLSRKQYEKKINNLPRLKKIGFKYKKNYKDMFNILKNNGGDIKKAILYAKKLEKNNKINNPSTGVYKFVEFFLPYLNE